MPVAYNPTAWTDFFAAQIAASAALAGLVFVAISINLSKIIGNPLLVSRSAKGLSILVGVLLAATLALTPGQPLIAIGCELAALGCVLWIAATWAQLRSSRKNPYIGPMHKILHLALTQGATLPLLVCGISLLAGRGGGFYWLLASVVFSFIASMADAWVLLIEIQR
jgi:hypothetical protein